MRIFVFGSNLAGRHGKGAALDALKLHGAIYGQGEGRQGASYGIPTKDRHLRTLPLTTIALHVATFLRHAAEHPEDTFYVTRVGCGLAGYQDKQMAPLFYRATANVELPDGWALDF